MGSPSPLPLAVLAMAPTDLSEDVMNLSEVGKTIDGDGFAYFKLDCVDKNVGSIAALSEFEHLRQIDLSKNSIEDVTPLADLRHILQLNLSTNVISQINPWGDGCHTHLMHLDMSGNRLQALPPLQMPALKTASFARNEIDTCQAFTGHIRLEVLDLSANKLTALNGVGNMPSLTSLNVSSNNLASLEGIRALPALTDLDISANAFESLDGPWKEMASLSSLRAQSNRIAAVKGLEPLMEITSLRYLGVAANPLAEEDSGVNIRAEVLICHGRGARVITSSFLAKIDEEDVSMAEKEEAKTLNDDRIEQERQRKLEEEAAAAEAAAAAAEAAAAGGGDES